MRNLIALILLIAAAVHGYFYVSYGTADPCKAAAIRIVNQPSSEAGKALGQLMAGPVETRLRAKGALTCYQAMFDESPEALLQ
jgi:hypothetical protein